MLRYEGLINFLGWIVALAIAALLFSGLMAGACNAWPWVEGKMGAAQLERAKHNRKIAVEEAKAKEEAAKFESLAEIERARGVAEANRIIGDSLKDNDGYLQYLWINGLHDGNSETIYIPTEVNLPILEAGRFTGRSARSPDDEDDE